MADINAVDLTAETLESLDGTENVVGFDTAEGKKIQLSVLADYVTQKKTQTIGGSTQTIKAAVDTVTAKVNGQQIPDNSSLNNITTPGRYYTMSASGTATITDKPSDLDTAFTMDVQTRGGYLNQIIYNYTGAIYIRGKISSGWFDWSKLPTRAEMDAVSRSLDLSSQVTWAEGVAPASGNFCKFYVRGNLGIALLDFTSPSTVTSDKVIATLPTGYGSLTRSVSVIEKAWEKDKSAIIHVYGTNITLASTAWEASTRYVGQCIFPIA